MSPKRIKIYTFFLWFLIVLATVNLIYMYMTEGRLELSYAASVYAAAGIGIEALNQLKKQSSAA